MRPRFRFVVPALLLSSVLAQAADEIGWVRFDGAPGWVAAAPANVPPSGAAPIPLFAPTWFLKFPDAKVELVPEGTYDLASARGSVLLVDYWASWCVPCLKELPHLQKLHEARGAEGLVALAINAGEPRAGVADSAKQLGLTMKVAFGDPALQQSLGVSNLPALFAVDKQGRLRARWDGYRPGVEKEIAATVEKLLADDPSGTTRSVASVQTGAGALEGRWTRDLSGTADGVLGFSGGAGGAGRVVAAGGDQIVSYDAAGEVVARVRVGSAPGRLLDLGTATDGTEEIAGFRPGGTAIGVIALRTGGERSIAIPAPLLDVAVANDAEGGGRRLVMATMSGAATARASDPRAALVAGASGVRSVKAFPGGGVLTLSENGTIAVLSAPGKSRAKAITGAEKLLLALESGTVTATRSVTAAVSGRFLPGTGRQLAVATFAGHLALIDEATGQLMFDATWPAIHDLSAADLDGDGRDELLVASGRSVTVLGAAAR